MEQQENYEVQNRVTVEEALGIGIMAVGAVGGYVATAMELAKTAYVQAANVLVGSHEANMGLPDSARNKLLASCVVMGAGAVMWARGASKSWGVARASQSGLTDANP